MYNASAKPIVQYSFPFLRAEYFSITTKPRAMHVRAAGYPTLDGRANYEICYLCWWEDDGQDDDSATLIFGGPTHDYSLRDARANFARSGVMYSQGREQDVVKQRIVHAFDELLHAPIADHARLWQVIAEDEQLLAGMSSHNH